METRSRARDLDKERRERESFIALQHACTLLQEGVEEVPRQKLGEDLGYSKDTAKEVLDLLARCGCVDITPDGRRMTLTNRGSHYVLRGAGRRRSVREETFESGKVRELAGDD